MLNSQINQFQSFHNLVTLQKPFLARAIDATHHSSSSAYSHTTLLQPTTTKKSNATPTRRSSAGKIKSRLFTDLLKLEKTKVTGVIHTKSTYLHSLEPSRLLDDAASLLYSSVKLEFVFHELDCTYTYFSQSRNAV